MYNLAILQPIGSLIVSHRRLMHEISKYDTTNRMIITGTPLHVSVYSYLPHSIPTRCLTFLYLNRIILLNYGQCMYHASHSSVADTGISRSLLHFILPLVFNDLDAFQQVSVVF